jgi:hypothetical protein
VVSKHLSFTSATTFRFLILLYFRILFRATVSLATASDADFNVLSSTELNFNPGNTDETIAIVTKDDSVIEADEVFVVTLSTTSPSVKIDKVKGVTTITINDNDGKCSVPHVTFLPALKLICCINRLFITLKRQFQLLIYARRGMGSKVSYY